MSLFLSLLLVFVSTNEGYAYSIDEFATVQQTSKAFTKIAKRVIPAVVFIKVEQTVESGQALTPFEFNNPFDLFNDDFFDVVNMSYVFHEISDKTKALDEIRRVLKPGGTFYLCEFHRRNIMTFLINGIYFVIFKKKEYWMDLLRKKGLKNVIYINQGTVGIVAASKMTGE